MIVSDSHRMVFIHIPKCAGTTVRRALRPFDSHHGLFEGFFAYPDGGRQHLQHLPLADVQSYFPDIYEKLLRYDSYAIMRAPRERFASALLQYLRSFRQMEAQDCSARLFRRHALEIRERLADPASRHALDLMHFVPQVALIQVEGRQVVRNLYRMDSLARFAADLQARHDIALDLGLRHNQAHLPGMRMLKHVARPLLRLLPADRHRRLRAALRTVTGSAPHRLYHQLFEDSAVCTFVDSFYAEDMALYATLPDRA